MKLKYRATFAKLDTETQAVLYVVHQFDMMCQGGSLMVGEFWHGTAPLLVTDDHRVMNPDRKMRREIAKAMRTVPDQERIANWRKEGHAPVTARPPSSSSIH